MNLYNELDFTYSNTNYSFSSFTHQILPNNTINYYMNDDRGISIYDQDWNFIKRINLKSLDQKISLNGNIFIDDEFIYIGNVFFSNLNSLFLKVDLDLHIINYVAHYTLYISSTFDSCNKRIFLLWVGKDTKINIDVYNLSLRKISEINSTSINSAIDIYPEYWSVRTGLGLFNNQLYIFYKDVNSYQSILVTDINGQYITKHVLIEYFSELINPITFDHFGNILFTMEGQLCLFSIFLNMTRKCIEKTINPLYYFSTFNYPLYAQMDLSGRLVVIDVNYRKMQFYGPLETKSKILIFYQKLFD
jgi:hypothetical protein